jgi:uncharacterized protein
VATGLPYVLLLHGYAGSGPRHWQNWLAGHLAHLGGEVDVPTFTDPDQPVLDLWLDELREHLDAAPDDRERVVLTHSLGANLWLHHAAARPPARRQVDRVLLVAPAGPDWHEPDVKGFLPVPVDPAGLRTAAADTRLVTSDDDPTITTHQAHELATALDIEWDVIPGGGHLDTASGYGRWPSALEWARHATVPLRAH